MKVNPIAVKYMIYMTKIIAYCLVFAGFVGIMLDIDLGVSLSSLTNFTFLTVGSLLVFEGNLLKERVEKE